MNLTPQDLTALRIVAHLGDKPEVPTYVAHRLAEARAVALSRARTSPKSVRVGPVLALQTFASLRARLVLGLATAALVAGYCANLASQDNGADVFAWHAEDDTSHYVELLQD